MWHNLIGGYGKTRIDEWYGLWGILGQIWWGKIELIIGPIIRLLGLPIQNKTYRISLIILCIKTI